MPKVLLPTDQLLTRLAAAPGRLAAATAGVPPVVLHRAPSPGEWSARDLLAHLRSCADVWGDAIAAMLSEDAPTLKAVNPTTWIDRTDYPRAGFADSLHAFTAQRDELIAVLTSLPAGDWSRAATLTGAGRPLQRTVHSYADWLARHERPHLRQVGRAVADRACGP